MWTQKMISLYLCIVVDEWKILFLEQASDQITVLHSLIASSRKDCSNNGEQRYNDNGNRCRGDGSRNMVQ